MIFGTEFKYLENAVPICPVICGVGRSVVLPLGRLETVAIIIRTREAIFITGE